MSLLDDEVLKYFDLYVLTIHPRFGNPELFRLDYVGYVGKIWADRDADVAELIAIKAPDSRWVPGGTPAGTQTDRPRQADIHH